RRVDARTRLRPLPLLRGRVAARPCRGVEGPRRHVRGEQARAQVGQGGLVGPPQAGQRLSVADPRGGVPGPQSDQAAEGEGGAEPVGPLLAVPRLPGVPGGVGQGQHAQAGPLLRPQQRNHADDRSLGVGEPAAIGADRLVDSVRFLRAWHRFAGGEVPDDPLVIQGPGNQPPAVGAEAHAQDYVGVPLEGQRRLPRAGVPQPHRLVPAGRGQAAAVGAEAHAAADEIPDLGARWAAYGATALVLALHLPALSFGWRKKVLDRGAGEVLVRWRFLGPLGEKVYLARDCKAVFVLGRPNRYHPPTGHYRVVLNRA